MPGQDELASADPQTGRERIAGDAAVVSDVVEALNVGRKGRFDSAKPFMVGMLTCTNIADAVEAAVAASRLEANAFAAQICQPFQQGSNGYQGSSVVVAHFRNGVDLDELAADEDGVPDVDRRSQALRPRQ